MLMRYETLKNTANENIKPETMFRNSSDKDIGPQYSSSYISH